MEFVNNRKIRAFPTITEGLKIHVEPNNDCRLFLFAMFIPLNVTWFRNAVESCEQNEIFISSNRLLMCWSQHRGQHYRLSQPERLCQFWNVMLVYTLPSSSLKIRWRLKELHTSNNIRETHSTSVESSTTASAPTHCLGRLHWSYSSTRYPILPSSLCTRIARYIFFKVVTTTIHLPVP